MGRRLRDRLGIPAGRTVVGHLATLDPNKGTNDLVLAVARLNATRPADDPVHLILAGPSSPCFERFLAERPEGSSPWVSILGPLALEDRAEFYDAIDVFAMPSRTDSFGIVFLEAWANGLPVVAADAGGVPEVVEHGHTGLLVPFGDLERLADALQQLIEYPVKARLMGETGVLVNAVTPGTTASPPSWGTESCPRPRLMHTPSRGRGSRPATRSVASSPVELVGLAMLRHEP